MSHDEADTDPTRQSPPAAADYGLFATRPSPPTSSPGANGENHHHREQGQPASALNSMALHKSQDLTLLQRWATHASESQFNALSGAVGGFTSGVVTCPLDVIKTKLQAQGGFLPVSKGRHVGHHKVYEGLIGTSRVIWKEEGIRGMYRGLGPIILGYLPTWAVWFTVYNKSKTWMAQHNSKYPTKSAGDQERDPSPPSPLCLALRDLFADGMWLPSAKPSCD